MRPALFCRRTTTSRSRATVGSSPKSRSHRMAPLLAAARGRTPAINATCNAPDSVAVVICRRAAASHRARFTPTLRRSGHRSLLSTSSSASSSCSRGHAARRCTRRRPRSLPDALGTVRVPTLTIAPGSATITEEAQQYGRPVPLFRAPLALRHRSRPIESQMLPLFRREWSVRIRELSSSSQGAKRKCSALSSLLSKCSRKD